MKIQEKLEEYAKVESVSVHEDDYGLLETTARVEIPEYSAIFAEYLEEVSETAKDENDFEKKLFALTEKKVKEAMKEETTDEFGWVSHEVMVELSLLDDEKEEWSEEELESLARRAAFEKELENFALDIVQAYMADKVDWDAPAGYRAQAQAESGEPGEEEPHE